MENPQPFRSDEFGDDGADETDEAIDTAAQIGLDERRMHVRAYNYWSSLLEDRAYPSIEDLDPASIEDFGANSILIDFTSGREDPAIVWLGKAIREECGIEGKIESIAEVPPRSLLSRLTDHYMQIIANQAPVGFEAEFENGAGKDMLYRGILMPFSSNDEAIDFIFGVISWKEAVDEPTALALHAEIEDAMAGFEPVPAEPAPAEPEDEDALELTETMAVADIPTDEPDIPQANIEPAEPATPESLADRLAIARDSAAEARDAHRRSRAALYEALGHAYDLALATEADPEGYAELLEETGIAVQDRAPMTPIVKLVFGIDYDKSRITEFAAALSYARREHLAPGSFADFLARYDGGLKAVVAAERALRRPAGTIDRTETARETLREATPRLVIDLPGEEEDGGEFTLLVARREDDGRLAILGSVPKAAKLTDQAIRKLAR